MPPVPARPAAVLWPGLPIVYLCVAGHPLGLLSGLPLDTWGLGLLLALALAGWCGARLPARAARLGAPAFGLAVGVRLLLAAAAAPYGLLASYATSADPAQPPERSTEWRLDGATRVEPGLELAGDRFPVYFFNDLRRFNFYTASQPRRDLLPFAVTWRGWLVPPTDGPACLELRANGSATVRLGELPPTSIARAGHVESRELCAPLGPGLQPLEARFSRPEGDVPYFSLAYRRPDGQAEPLGRQALLRQPVDAAWLARDRWLGLAARLLDLLVVGASLAIAVPGLARAARDGRAGAIERPILAAGVLLAFSEAVALQAHFAGRTPILSGGNDWLAYESYARDVLLSGPLMTGGKPLGQGEAFYYQPLYGYFLAGLHLLLGESVGGLLVAQYALVAIVGLLTFALVRELFGHVAAWVAIGLFWLFRYLIFNQVAGLLLSENLVVVFIPAMLLLLARWQRRRRRRDLAGAAVCLGLAILTRSTPLLFLPPALAIILFVGRGASDEGGGIMRLRRPTAAALGAAGLFLTLTLAVFGLAGLRNALVAGRWVFLPESASTNIYETHRPTARVDLSKIDRDPLYTRFGLDRRTREVLEFIRQDPLGYAATLVPMGLYPLGVTGPALGTGQLQVELLALTALYLGGVLFVPAARAPLTWPLHAFVLTHFAQMMVFMSHQYGFRLPLPMYGPMLVIAGRTTAGLLGRCCPWLGVSRRGQPEGSPLCQPDRSPFCQPDRSPFCQPEPPPCQPEPPPCHPERSPHCHPERSPHCHPERSEGSAPGRAAAMEPGVGPERGEILRCAQDDKGGKAPADREKAHDHMAGTAPAGGRIRALLALPLLAALAWSAWVIARPAAVEGPVFGLGGDAGPAARAVATSDDGWLADRLYFGGRDGRSFGVAYLPGLRYREMKWLDLDAALVWPSEGRRGLLIRPPTAGGTLLAACWPTEAQTARAAGQPADGLLLQWLPEPANRRCAPDERRLASFGGFVDLLGARPIAGPESTQRLEVAWRVAQRPSFRVQALVERLGPDGSVRATVAAEPYPAGSWEPGELVVARLSLPPGPPTDRLATAVAFTRGTPTARLTIDDPLPLYGQARLVVGP